ncbi:MAG: hypothetical protein Q4E28_01865 [Clostridia bacterium]|nr:hypothetical protein [Clostridia bacterium]
MQPKFIKTKPIEIQGLCQKVYNKLLEVEGDKDQARGDFLWAYYANNNPQKTLNELYDYMCDSKDPKSQNEISEFILDRDTEIQNRINKNQIKNANKVAF